MAVHFFLSDRKKINKSPSSLLPKTVTKTMNFRKLKWVYLIPGEPVRPGESLGRDGPVTNGQELGVLSIAAGLGTDTAVSGEAPVRCEARANGTPPEAQSLGVQAPEAPPRVLLSTR